MLIVDDNDDVNWKGFDCDIDNENCCSYDGDFEKTIVFTTFDDIDKETQPLGSKRIVFDCSQAVNKIAVVRKPK